MNNTNNADPGLTLTVLKEMASNYKQRVPEVYWRSFKAAVNRYIGRAKAMQYLQEGGHCGK
jgi:hypothetical protein